MRDKIHSAYWKITLLGSFFLYFSCSPSGNSHSFSNDHFEIIIDGQGLLSSIKDVTSGKDYLARDSISPLLSIRKDSMIYFPIKAEFNNAENNIVLDFVDSMTAVVKVEMKTTHINFELISFSDVNAIDMIVWGPYQTTIDSIIGETVGVVRGKEFALGLQALNPKTLGGYPWTDNDCMPQINIFAQDDLSDMSENNKDYVLYRVEAAKPTSYGSSLQAYCRNRTENRKIQNLNHDHYIAPAYKREDVVGSKIALFGSPVKEALNTIG